MTKYYPLLRDNWLTDGFLIFLRNTFSFTVFTAFFLLVVFASWPLAINSPINVSLCKLLSFGVTVNSNRVITG